MVGLGIRKAGKWCWIVAESVDGVGYVRLESSFAVES